MTRQERTEARHRAAILVAQRKRARKPARATAFDPDRYPEEPPQEEAHAATARDLEALSISPRHAAARARRRAAGQPSLDEALGTDAEAEASRRRRRPPPPHPPRAATIPEEDDQRDFDEMGLVFEDDPADGPDTRPHPDNDPDEGGGALPIEQEGRDAHMMTGGGDRDSQSVERDAEDDVRAVAEDVRARRRRYEAQDAQRRALIVPELRVSADAYEAQPSQARRELLRQEMSELEAKFDALQMDAKHGDAKSAAAAIAAGPSLAVADNDDEMGSAAPVSVPKGGMLRTVSDAEAASAAAAAAAAKEHAAANPWGGPLRGERLELKSRWKGCHGELDRLRQEEAFGMTVQAIDADGLLDDQLAAVLLRPLPDETSDQQLLARLQLWVQAVHMLSADVKDGVARADRLYFGAATVMELEQRQLALAAATQRLAEVMTHRAMLSMRTEMGRRYREQIMSIQCNLDTLFVMKLSTLDLMSGTRAHVSSKLTQLASERSSVQNQQQNLAAAKEQWSSFVQLLDKLLDKAQEWRLVRIDGQVYEPQYCGKGQWTRSYKLWRSGEIFEFVHYAASLKHKDPELYGMLYDRGSYWKQVAEILKINVDDRFPDLEPSRFWYAFDTGVYCISDDRFYAYDSLGFKHLPEDIVCCNYFPQKFDNTEYEWQMRHGISKTEPWYNILTPQLNKICRTQQWSHAECKWWYAGGGRMLFPCKQHDTWQKMWLHLGRAGTGKTTFLKYVASFFPRYRIGVINNNCEKIFTIQHLEKTWSWFGFDIKENWNLDQALWNTMVEGGLLPLARKFQTAKLTDFVQHGAVASNRLMNWPDLNGQFLRRLFPHLYKHSPLNMGSPTLARDMEMERGAALKKMACGYLFKAMQHKTEQLHDNMLPHSIRSSLALIRREANPLMAFLDSSKIVLHPSYYMDHKRFSRAFQEFSIDIGVRGGRSLPTVNDAFFADVLEAKNLRMAKDERIVPTGCAFQPNNPQFDHTAGRQKTTQLWIIGCAFRDVEDQQPGYRPDNSLPPFDPNAPPAPLALALAAPPLAAPALAAPQHPQHHQQLHHPANQHPSLPLHPSLALQGGNGNALNHTLLQPLAAVSAAGGAGSVSVAPLAASSLIPLPPVAAPSGAFAAPSGASVAFAPSGGPSGGPGYAGPDGPSVERRRNIAPKI
jgi:hypothetical protein